MKLFKRAGDLSAYLVKQEKNNTSIGFVPTMGALHSGHLSLIASAKSCNGITVCSIFINPTQFNVTSDFEKYPVTLEKDIELLITAGCDVVFIPSVAEIYPQGLQARRLYNLGYLETILEGKYRPGHFQGVCQVVHRLLEIVRPRNMYLGQKDYQQCMVLKTLVNLLAMDTSIIVCPTLREKDGLAMSSRNMRLDEQERQLAVIISQTLLQIKNEIATRDLRIIKAKATDKLVKHGYTVDYVEIAAAETLIMQNSWDGEAKLIALVAAFLNEVRLIDNMILN